MEFEMVKKNKIILPNFYQELLQKECLHTHKSNAKILSPNVMILDGILGADLSCKGTAFMHGSSAL
jgi:hypothetical protein